MSNEIKIKTPYIELDSFLKFSSVCMTGGEAKIMIKSGKVMVNGEVCTMRKKKLINGDKVCVNNCQYTVVGQ